MHLFASHYPDLAEIVIIPTLPPHLSAMLGVSALEQFLLNGKKNVALKKAFRPMFISEFSTKATAKSTKAAHL